MVRQAVRSPTFVQVLAFFACLACAAVGGAAEASAELPAVAEDAACERESEDELDGASAESQQLREQHDAPPRWKRRALEPDTENDVGPLSSALARPRLLHAAGQALSSRVPRAATDLGPAQHFLSSVQTRGP